MIINNGLPTVAIISNCVFVVYLNFFGCSMFSFVPLSHIALPVEKFHVQHIMYIQN